jgi:hypothetical protein
MVIEPSAKFISNKFPHIIEFVGVAGTGKSTLLKAMMQRDKRIMTLPLPSKYSYIPFLLRVVLNWWPIYLNHYRNSRWFTFQEIRNMGYLDTWIPFIRSQASTRQNIVGIDPGSIYWLASLQEFGPKITQHPKYQNWLKEKLEQWASALDVAIWLDAPEELCLQRVLGRDEFHEIKDVPANEALAELKGYRQSYKRILSQMSSRFAIKTFYFRTDQIPTDQIVERVFSEIDLQAEQPALEYV